MVCETKSNTLSSVVRGTAYGSTMNRPEVSALAGDNFSRAWHRCACKAELVEFSNSPSVIVTYGWYQGGIVLNHYINFKAMGKAFTDSRNREI